MLLLQYFLINTLNSETKHNLNEYILNLVTQIT